MKKIITVILVLALAVGLTACSVNKPSDSSSAAFDTVYKIGICNYVDDASLNQIVSNIRRQLKTLGDEKRVTFEILYDNSNADANVMSQIIANFIANDVDLMVGVATPVAVTMQAATEDNQIPVVFSAVSDPLAASLVETLEAPGSNVTGTSDYLDTNAIMNLVFAANPKADKIGLLYDVGQDSSTTAIVQAKAYLDKKGVEYVERTGTNVDEVMLAATALVADQVDAVFTPSDNTIMQAELSIYETLAKAGIPHYAGADSFALNGAFLGYGVDYANLGVESANMVADILINKKAPANTPVKTFDNGTATINTEICTMLGLNFDEVSAKFQPFCTKVESVTTAESF
ncbi:MAG: ABC transporter substrate-binding protein [Oscillospiraceae bacterium]|nr:ABC transporter substrate-binding protein [Oscillospiraceae bacterium]MDD3833283.1 ABC transporter substrate-binding protein [Oscillospiraceae bacterium]MDD4546971.1 ABC transporter substrate-binding protein [Oscillospiraceae bacterium]